jgi:hypothetical protein
VLDDIGQVDCIVTTILENREAGVALKEQAVLFRTAHHSAMLEIELTRRNIPFVKFGGLKFIEAAHVKDMLSVLRWAENPADRVTGFRVLQLLDGIGPATAGKVLDRISGRARIIATPEGSRDLRTDVMVMIQRRDSGEVMMDAAVDLSFVPPAGEKLSPNDVLCGPSPSQPGSIRALRAQAANKFFYGIPVVLRAAGNWQLRATIRQGVEEASVTCILPVGIPPHRLMGLWPYLALPPVAIVLFAMNQWLRRRPARAAPRWTCRSPSCLAVTRSPARR